AENTYKEAVAAADALNDPRAVSYASGYLGRLYEDRKQYQDALQLTQRAIASAQRVNAPESLYRWQWQKGRILKALGQTDDAISAYRSASSTIESIRQEMSKCYGKAVKSFREPAGPLYLEFVDLLLQQAALPGDPKQVQPYLLEAREAVESLKVSELRDYFRDDCVDAARTVATKLDA
ncbi:MAG TPA: hypothetical protein DCZ69_17700, partial [Syntrophobacteraceae bacterium]|nr:hypothetical protein [Syntrophobacteraceae bacterium]